MKMILRIHRPSFESACWSAGQEIGHRRSLSWGHIMPMSQGTNWHRYTSFSGTKPRRRSSKGLEVRLDS